MRFNVPVLLAAAAVANAAAIPRSKFNDVNADVKPTVNDVGYTNVGRSDDVKVDASVNGDINVLGVDASVEANVNLNKREIPVVGGLANGVTSGATSGVKPALDNVGNIDVSPNTSVSADSDKRQLPAAKGLVDGAPSPVNGVKNIGQLGALDKSANSALDKRQIPELKGVVGGVTSGVVPVVNEVKDIVDPIVNDVEGVVTPVANEVENVGASIYF